MPFLLSEKKKPFKLLRCGCVDIINCNHTVVTCDCNHNVVIMCQRMENLAS